MIKSNKDKWVLPTMTTRLIDNLVKYGNETEETIKNKRKFSKTREAWIASIFLLRKILTEGRLWYLRQNYIEDSVDDIYARSLEQINGVVYSDKILPIQVFRRTEYSEETLLDSIKKKLKDDLQNTSLVLYVIRDEVILWDTLMDEVKKINPKVIDITIIGNIGGRKFIVGQVFPSKFISFVNLDLYKISGNKMIEAEEVIKPEETGITKLGKALLTPTFDVLSL